ncbi:phage tail protein I [Salmonella enterica subsp. enterica serovar Java]|uniref:Phage tail protein I n=1 Tax=Salmonella enterica TaxID=28901 RepID=A0A754B4L8_SALER|nr:phage tail protein I [Salmonella enterica]EBW3150351.1 phage tail protein I [Salmonella enterica subsp. enterica serovar Java]EBX7466578.1 phage tail protein I [Salmonella enterica subsp. enterica serovar Bareilly]ECU9161663.1 phage tail protein I [Salmonella enterica subsp. enterica serovar Newport str. CFSAN000599]EDU1195096.1 phage tail protein I [Salmonella enterica subsp. enterica serovar Heidelberg str. CFSAN000576]EAM6405815.1 phage tail protein I [Salmonella enterica]
MADKNMPLAPPLAADKRFSTLARLAEMRFSGISLTPLLVYLIDMTETSALPWLAGQLSLTGDNGWDLAESDEAKRELIKNAIELFRYKGTPWSVRQVIRNLGFGEIELREGAEGLEASIATKYPPETHWALYQVILLSTPVTNDQAALIRRTLESFAPARSELAVLDFTAAPIRYNNTARYDGAYNHGKS